MSPKRAVATEAFWAWYGKQAKAGKVEAGNKDTAAGLQAAFRAGWDARDAEDERRLREST